MERLPALDALCLGDPTGAPEAFQFWKRDSGKVSDDKKYQTTIDPVRLTRQATRQGADEPLPVKDKEWLKKFAAALRNTEARAPTDLRVLWRDSVMKTMSHKVAHYEALAVSLEEKVERARDAMARQLGSYTAGSRPLVAPNTPTWDIIKESDKIKLFNAYVDMVATANQNKDAARAKEREFAAAIPGTPPNPNRSSNRGAPSSAAFNALCEQLSVAIDTLVTEYPGQEDLLNAVAMHFNAFVKNPAVARQKSFNFIIMGNAGVGKTRLAMTLGKALGALGMYVYSDVKVIDRSALVAEYEGQTAPRSKQTLSDGLERVIFLDEAYSVTVIDEKPDGRKVPNPYSQEAIVELLTHLELQKGNTTFIAAGYEGRMLNEFLAFNDGLKSRFTNYVRMDDYEPDELRRIFVSSLARFFTESDETHLAAVERVGRWFSSEALAFLEYVFCESAVTHTATVKDEENEGGDLLTTEDAEYPHMKRLWSAQARQMVNMASLAADMLSSSEVFEQLGVSDDGTESFVLSPHDMYRMIGNTVERDEGVGGGIPFMLELQIIAKEGGWVSDAGNWGVPGGTMGGGACKRKQSEPPGSSGGANLPASTMPPGAPSEADEDSPGGPRRGRSLGGGAKAPKGS